MRSANSNSKCSPTDSPPPDNSPTCPVPRSTDVPHPPNAFPASETPWHRGAPPPPNRFFSGLVVPSAALQPASPDRPKVRLPPSDAVTDACDGHCWEPAAQPSAPHSCVLQVTTIRCSNSSAEYADPNAPRRWPSPQYMPRSASAVGLAKRGVIPRKQFYIKLLFFNTVILACCPRLRKLD